MRSQKTIILDQKGNRYIFSGKNEVTNFLSNSDSDFYVIEHEDTHLFISKYHTERGKFHLVDSKVHKYFESPFIKDLIIDQFLYFYLSCIKTVK